jgi:hypothetical protein
MSSSRIETVDDNEEFIQYNLQTICIVIYDEETLLIIHS